jgi:nucleotide-binding universal stress UspA family protein
MRTILVALDESETSERVAAFVNAFFEPDRTRILAINVASSPAPWLPATAWGGVWGWGYVPPGATVPYQTYAREEFEEQAQHQESEAISTVLSSGIRDAEAVAELGDPVSAINRAAAEHDVDLIVVGTRDRNALQRMVFGSVSDDLVHHAERPVLVVR